MNVPLLKPEEQTVLNLLAEAYNQFVALPTLHPWDQQEFMAAVHAAQRIVMARPAQRQQQENPWTL